MNITLNITIPKLNPYSKRQWHAQVAITTPADADGNVTFKPIPVGVLGRDSVEWGSFIGSHCAKQLPKTHKISQRRVLTAWAKNGCP
jgi:hypothetical protein